MPAARTCLECDELVPAGRTLCVPCQRERYRERDLERGSPRERGYDAEHERLRAHLLPLAIDQPCPRCGEPMLEHQALDLGHTIARSIDPSSRADRIEHAKCNRGAGAR